MSNDIVDADFTVVYEPGDMGLIHNLSFEDYLAIEAVSKTKLAKFAKTPAHSQVDTKDTDAMLMGRAFHTTILEPHLFDKAYTTYPDGVSGTTKAGKAFKKEHPDHEFLNKTQWAEVMGMSEAIKTHIMAMNLINNGMREVSAIWEHPKYGFTCKNRYDIFRPDKRIIADLKKTAPADFANIENIIPKYKYHWQAAFYIQGAEVCTEMVGGWQFIFIFVESVPPYSVRYIRPTYEMIFQAREEIKQLIPEYARCLHNNTWPGLPEVIEDMDLSDWAQRQFNSQ